MTMLPPPSMPERPRQPPPPPLAALPAAQVAPAHRRWPKRAGALVVALVLVGGAVAGGFALLDRGERPAVQVRDAAGLRPLPEGLRTMPRNAWTFHPGSAEVRWTTVDDAGDVFAVLAAEGGLEVVRLGAESGEVHWRVPLDAADVTALDTAGQQVFVALGGADARLVSLDRTSGATRWEFRAGGAPVDEFVAAEGGLAAVLLRANTGDGSLVVVDSEGHEAWSTPAQAARLDGQFVLVQRAASTALVELPTGSTLWERPLDGAFQIALDGDHAYVADRRHLTAFGPDGELLWRTAVAADDPVEAVTQGDGLVVVLRASGLVALSSQDGVVAWEAPPGGVVPDTDRDALTIRTTDEDLTLRVIAGDGRARATRLVGPAASVRVAQGVVYVDDGLGVTAYDRTSLAQLWTTVVSSDGGVTLVAAADRGVLVRDGSGNLVMLR